MALSAVNAGIKGLNLGVGEGNATVHWAGGQPFCEVRAWVNGALFGKNEAGDTGVEVSTGTRYDGSLIRSGFPPCRWSGLSMRLPEMWSRRYKSTFGIN